MRHEAFGERRVQRLGALLLAAFCLIGVLPEASSAQLDRAGLQQLCPQPEGCWNLALGIEAMQAGIGLAAAGGADLPGGNSTLGWRFGTVPRVAVSARLGITSGRYPALNGSNAEAQTTWTPSFEGALAISAFDGFRPLPTIGGVFALDFIGVAGTARPSASDGFEGSVSSFGYGVRLGLLRESFTMPGVTISAVRRHLAELRWNGADGDRPGRVVLDGPTATSLRATVGKDLLALGLVAGVGWDRVDSNGSFVVDGVGAAGPLSLTFDDFRTERTLVFGGASLTLLVLQLSGEVGYAAGFEPRPVAAGSAGFDPTAGNLFATVSARLLF